MLDLNIILLPIVILLIIVSLVSGVLLIVRALFSARSHINRSVNMDLEIVRVAKPLGNKKEDSSRDESWKEEIGSMEQLFATLGNIRLKGAPLKRLLYGDPHIVLEIANPSDSEEIFFYMAVPKKFRQTIEKQVHSYFPNASLEKVKDYTIFRPGSYTSSASLALKDISALPLLTYESMNVDPLSEITNSLSKLDNEEEGAVLQVVMKPAGNDWRKKGRSIAHQMQQGKRLSDIHHSYLKGIGKELVHATMSNNSSNSSTSLEKENIQLTPEEQELIKEIERKSTKAGFLVNVRVLASAVTQQRADEILGNIENAFSQFENVDSNHFVVRKRKKKRVAFDYIFRNFNDKFSFILNTEELASIFHFPISTTETPKINWLKSGSAPPPVNVPKEGILLGYNDYRGVETEIRMTDDDRRRHIYTIGQTGTGKSNLLKEMAKQDVRSGKGVCIIDPHGDFAEDVLAAVPKERAEDVIYFDPADTERPVGLNMLEYERPEEKTFVINEMISIFDKLYDLKQTGGPMFEQYVRNAMLLIMEDPETGSTLMEISKVLADEDFRRMKLEKCQNPVVKDFWIKEAEKAGGEAALANIVPYITSKLTTFISNDMMRPIIAQQNSTINFREIMDEGKILIVNLSKGKLGEINSHLLGLVVVGKILLSALSRVNLPEEQRKDFYLYIDEFQNVTTDSIAQILSEARKYHLNLIIAHQFIGQLSEKISKAVFGNVGSMCALRVGPEDAEFLEKQFEPVFGINDLVNVDNRNCFVKLQINNELSKPFNIKTYPPSDGDQKTANHLKELSRLKYGRDSTMVNKEIMERVRLSEKF